MSRFNNRSVLVTGGTAGIGKAIVQAFVAEGARVLFTGRNAQAGEALAAQSGARFLKSDAAAESDVAAAISATVAAYGGLDIAVNNAGVEGQTGPITEQTEANYRHIFDINVLGVALAMKYQIPALLQRGSGAIVNLASIAGLVGMPGASLYVASKHAVAGLTRSAALEFAGSGIRINAVAPGAVDTDMMQRFTGGSADIQAGLKAAHPLGRAATVTEVAQAVLYLSSDAASFTTGVVLPIDGGYTAQ